MTGSVRSERVGHLIQQLLSELLRRDISDPRLQAVTITEVKVARDLRVARIYFTAVGGSAAAANMKAGFQRALGYIKRSLGPRLGLRYMPDLEFHYDESFDRGAHIERLLKAVRPPEADGEMSGDPESTDTLESPEETDPNDGPAPASN
jgi:ribosome-binding factor A